VPVRICVSVIGHWSVTYWCHNPGPGTWRVKAAAVQASNLRGLGLLTYGECWHNNHHAFPESARIGLAKDQADPAAWIIEALAKLGWTWNIGTPRPESQREDLELVAPEAGDADAYNRSQSHRRSRQWRTSARDTHCSHTDWP
jgi:stearoyl-CoA desaturase (delta-9 desaturase)